MWKRASNAIKFLLLPILLFFTYYIYAVVPADAWQATTLSHPLGIDEFGRDIFATSIAAACLSFIKGIWISTIALLLAFAVAYGIAILEMSEARILLRMTALVVESVPIYLWVLVVLILVREPRAVIVLAAFAIAITPYASSIIAGEISRLRKRPYVEAAFIAGASNFRIFYRYILPNSLHVILPLAIQIMGSAIAVDGAIGVLGAGNRSDIDLGTFLFRGKENFDINPMIFIVSIAWYGVIYLLLFFFQRMVSSKSGDFEKRIE